MHRSASTTRVSDDYPKYHSSPPSSKASPTVRALSLETSELPVFEPPPEVSKKEKSRAKLAENAVHLIPLVLILCALILWFFSNPDTIAARIEGLTLEGGEVDGDNAETGVLAGIDLGDLDPGKQDEVHHKSSTIQKYKYYS